MSTTTPRGLGRGLGELFQRTETSTTQPPDPAPPVRAAGAEDLRPSPLPSLPREHGGLVPVPQGATYREISVDAITPNPRQPRTDFDEEALQELADSVADIGLLQPVVVRPLETGPAERFELVMGERRWRAAQRAGLDLIPAIVRRTEDHDLLRDALLENLHRAQLNPLEEAAAYAQMLDDFGCTQDELAGRIKRSRPQISNTIRLLRLPPTVQRRVAAGVLSAGHARALLSLADALSQERLAQRVVAEGLSVRSTEELVALDSGQVPSPRPRRRTLPATVPEAEELAAALSDWLETRVRVEIGQTRGRIVIDTAGWDDLQRIAGVIGCSPSPGKISPDKISPDKAG